MLRVGCELEGSGLDELCGGWLSSPSPAWELSVSVSLEI